MSIWALSLSTMDLTSIVSLPIYTYGILSLIWFGKLVSPLANSVLYPHSKQ